MSRLFRVWPEIAKIKGVRTRAAISFETEPDCLDKLQQVFPSCFSKTKVKGFPVPLSALLAAAENHFLARLGGEDLEYERAFVWDCILDKFGIPVLVTWTFDEDDDIPEYLPIDVAKQLAGLKLELDTCITWNGGRCRISEISLEIKPGEVLPNTVEELYKNRYFSLSLISAECIDFRS